MGAAFSHVLVGVVLDCAYHVGLVEGHAFDVERLHPERLLPGGHVGRKGDVVALGHSGHRLGNGRPRGTPRFSPAGHDRGPTTLFHPDRRG